MTKDTISATVDPEVSDYLSQDSVNASGLINRLVKNHATAGDRETAMLELREEQLQSEVESLRGELQQKEQELERVQERLEEMTPETERVVQEAREQLTNFAALDAENPAIIRWADKAGITPEELVERLQQQR